MSATSISLLHPDAEGRLARLGEDVKRQIELDAGIPQSWTPASDTIHPVLVAGAGQAGLAVAHGLRRKGVGNVLVVDSADADHVGSWATYARMKTLRTPKDIRWPTWGVSATAPRAWHDAVFGSGAWDEIEYFPTDRWQSYLAWYRAVLDINVEQSTCVESIEGGENGTPFFVTLNSPQGRRVVRAEHIVLATGLEGAGGRRVPDLLQQLPSDRWAHSHDAIDFSTLGGVRVGVLGGGTGAFDNAATALEAGAHTVEVHMRRPMMPTVSPYRWMEFPGLVEHYAAFSDEQKWAFNLHLAKVDQPATQNAIWRAYDHHGFSFHTASPWQSAQWDGSEIVVETPLGQRRFDFVIAATGIAVDLRRRTELVNVAEDVALWRDRLPLSSQERDPASELLDYPYLTADFGLTSRSGTQDERLARIHMFNHGARMSLGMLSHQVSGLYGGAERLVTGLGEALFASQSARLLADYLTYDAPSGVVVGPRPVPVSERVSQASHG